MNDLTLQMQSLSRRITYLMDLNDGFVDDEILSLMDQYNKLGLIKQNLQENGNV